MIYMDYRGTLTDAVNYIQKFGGQLTQSKDKKIVTIVRGSYCVTFIDPSYDYQKLINIALALEIEPFQGMTESRLIKKFLKEVIKLNPKGTYFGGAIQKFAASSGEHWGYQYFREHEACDCIQLDVRAAYLRSLLTFPSMLFKEPSSWFYQVKDIEKLRPGESPIEDYINRLLHRKPLTHQENYAWLDDGGAMGRLRSYSNLLCNDKRLKPFRLKMLGIIAARKFEPMALDEQGVLQSKTIHKIEWGGAFNAIQLAVVRLYQTCQQAVQIAGEYCVRWHTDGGVFRCDMPKSIEDEIINLFSSRGFELRCKGAGFTKLWGLNIGFIGAYGIAGFGHEVASLMRRDGLKFRLEDLTSEIVERWWHYLVTHSMISTDKDPVSGQVIFTKTVYGFFQNLYESDEQGNLQSVVGIFYCFCCSIQNPNPLSYFLTTEVPCTKVVEL